MGTTQGVIVVAVLVATGLGTDVSAGIVNVPGDHRGGPSLPCSAKARSTTLGAYNRAT